MSVIKMGGKSDSNTVKSVSVGDTGAVRTEKRWTYETVTLFDKQVSDTTVLDTLATELNIGEMGFVSLHFVNETGVEISFRLLRDDVQGSVLPLYDSAGTFIAFSISDKKHYIITADDLPVLNYIKLLKLRIQPLAAPATPGNLKIYVRGKN